MFASLSQTLPYVSFVISAALYTSIITQSYHMFASTYRVLMFLYRPSSERVHDYERYVLAHMLRMSRAH